MSYELIITEKPSAAARIANALADSKARKESNQQVPYYRITHNGKPIVVACAVGHLYTVAEKNKSFKYPVFEVEWKPTWKTDKSAKYTNKYINTIKKLSRDASSYVVACDFDIEGETIGYNVVRFICRQEDAARMKFSTLTTPDIKYAYRQKQPHLEWGQANAGVTRHVLDWYYGINVSRALMLAIKQNNMFKTLSSGRVQGPALKILVEREKEIQAFVPKPYWQLQLLGQVKQGEIEAWHAKDKFWDKKECEAILEKTKGRDGSIRDIERKEKKQPPPTPFDLTTLQMEAYRHFKISPKDTLAQAQNLYLKGLISYPRTSSQKLPPKIGYKKIMAKLCKQKEYSELVNKLSNKALKPFQGKKTDPAHPAIFPTGLAPKAMPARETKIYDLIVKRFLATFGPWATREHLKLTIDVNKEHFYATGARTTERGWHIFYQPYAKFKEVELPKVEKNDEVKVKEIIKHDKETKPPKRYTQASIIKELEKRELGTKSTRAHIVDSLFQRGYVDEKSIQATKLGMKIVETLEEYCPEIQKEELTRHFEDEMDKIREQKTKPEIVLEEAKHELSRILKKFKENEKVIGKKLAEAYRESMTTEIGQCPECKKGTLVVKSSRKTKQRFLACDKYPDCRTTFSVPQRGKIKSVDKLCEHCAFPLIEIANKRKHVVCFNPACPGKKIEDKELKKEVKDITSGNTEKKCPKCKGKLILRQSLYGKFLGCENYPKCKYTENLKKSRSKQGSEKEH